MTKHSGKINHFKDKLDRFFDGKLRAIRHDVKEDMIILDHERNVLKKR